jgi:hypothetical protein
VLYLRKAKAIWYVQRSLLQGKCSVDEGRRWAIETFGAHGVRIRERVAELIREEHAASADAQEMSGHRSLGVYGEFWRGILERFEEFGSLPHAALARPGQAPYKIPVVNGVAIFPWRYGRTRGEDLASTPFATSEARSAMFALDSDAAQGELNLGLPGPGLTSEEQELADAVETAISDALVTTSKAVVVAVSSSPLGLQEMSWGEVTITNDGCLKFGFSEDLTELAFPGPVGAVDSRKTFTAGEPPTKVIRLQSEPGEAADDDE